MARPTSYTEEIGAKVCEAIAVSESGLRKTLESDPELPTLRVVEYWLQNNAQFCSDYAQAKRRQIEMLAEDIVDLSNDDSLDPNDKRIRIETRKWLLSKLIPKTYGDKLDVTSDGQPLQVASHLIDARVQSIIMQAHQRRLGQEPEPALSPEALKLLD